MHVSRALGLPAPRRAWLAAAASAALLAATLLDAGVAGAANPAGAGRFQRLPETKVSGFTPAGLDKTPLTVMLQLAGEPVTVADAHAGGHLSKAERSALQAQLKSAQAGVIRAAKGEGARVVGSYQLAYNGVKVRATATELAKLAAIPGVIAIHRIVPIAPDNVHGVPLVGAPQVWDATGGNFHGEGVKVGVI